MMFSVPAVLGQFKSAELVKAQGRLTQIVASTVCRGFGPAAPDAVGVIRGFGALASRLAAEI
jgi:hypothetical protein